MRTIGGYAIILGSSASAIDEMRACILSELSGGFFDFSFVKIDSVL